MKVEISWPILSAILVSVPAIGFILVCLFHGVIFANTLISTPAQQEILADRLNLLETNSTAQFQRINWRFDRLESKLDMLVPVAAAVAPVSTKGQDQNNKPN